MLQKNNILRDSGLLQKYNKWKVLRVFFDDPNPKGAGFQLREISRKAGLAPTSVKMCLDELSKEPGPGKRRAGYPLIIKDRHRIHGYPVYWANRASELFRFYKKTDMTLLIMESGLLEFLDEKCMPDAIVLFGSASRGEDVKDSDVDLYLQCKKKPLSLDKYEKTLNRRVQIFFEEKFNKLSPELRNNILNGIILKGYLKVIQDGKGNHKNNSG